MYKIFFHDPWNSFQYLCVDRLAVSGGCQGVDVGRPVLVEVLFLVVDDAQALLGPRADGEDAHLEGLVVHLFQQTRVATGLLVALVDLAGAAALHHLAGHLLAADPHGEIGYRGVFGHGKRIEGFHLTLLQIFKYLGDLGYCDIVVNGNPDVVFYDFQFAAQASILVQNALLLDGLSQLGDEGYWEGRDVAITYTDTSAPNSPNRASATDRSSPSTRRTSGTHT